MTHPSFATVAALLGAAFTPFGVRAQAQVPEGVFPPVISITREAGRLRVVFDGVLQSADAATGPWTDVSGAVTPYLTDAGPDARKFFRSRGPAVSIFSARSVVTLAVTGPLQDNFEAAFAGTPDGIFPPHREKPWFTGSVSVAGFDVPGSLRVRGNSSLMECPFPKLKMKVSRDNRTNTPFADAREIKIGTHCADGGHGTIGRLRDQIAAYRETLAYETLSVLGFTAPRVRRAEILYRDTTPLAGSPDGGWQVTRQAMLLDDIEVVAERLGGRPLSDDEIAALRDAHFDEQLVTELEMFHALIGNWDYSLPANGEGLWNTDVIEFPDGRRTPVVGDFDLASWVTGMVRLTTPRDYHPELGEVERRARYEVEQLQAKVKPELFAAGRARYLANRAAIEQVVATGLVDDEGRTNIVRHINAFFDGLAAVSPR